MDDLIVTTELALIIVLPLIVFYQRLCVNYRRYALYVVLVCSIWFATYSLLHESSHLFTSWITGARIGDYRLIPRFWEGDFKNAYVNAELESRFQRFVSPASPYLRDMIFLFVGYAVLKRPGRLHALISGLTLVLFVLSPLYDVVNNYVAFARGSFSSDDLQVAGIPFSDVSLTVRTCADGKSACPVRRHADGLGGWAFGVLTITTCAQVGDLKGVAGDARVPHRRRASPLGREGAGGLELTGNVSPYAGEKV
jgi:hypothetical protein